MNSRGPKSFGRTTVHIHLYVDDVDKVVNQALGRVAATLASSAEKA